MMQEREENREEKASNDLEAIVFMQIEDLA